MRVGDFEIVTKDRCKADFETRDACLLNLVRLIARDPFFAARC